MTERLFSGDLKNEIPNDSMVFQRFQLKKNKSIPSHNPMFSMKNIVNENPPRHTLYGILEKNKKLENCKDYYGVSENSDRNKNVFFIKGNFKDKSRANNSKGIFELFQNDSSFSNHETCKEELKIFDDSGNKNYIKFKSEKNKKVFSILCQKIYTTYKICNNADKQNIADFLSDTLCDEETIDIDKIYIKLLPNEKFVLLTKLLNFFSEKLGFKLKGYHSEDLSINQLLSKFQINCDKTRDETLNSFNDQLEKEDNKFDFIADYDKNVQDIHIEHYSQFQPKKNFSPRFHMPSITNRESNLNNYSKNHFSNLSVSGETLDAWKKYQQENSIFKI